MTHTNSKEFRPEAGMALTASALTVEVVLVVVLVVVVGRCGVRGGRVEGQGAEKRARYCKNERDLSLTLSVCLSLLMAGACVTHEYA